MGDKNRRFEGDIKLPGGSFSRLLFSSSSSSSLSCDDDVIVDEKSLSVNSPLFSSNTPKMLCFGDFSSKFTPVFPLNDATTNLITSNSNKKRNGSGKESGSGSGSGSGLGNNQHQKTGMKKNKQEVGPIVTSLPGHAKVRREKLGERINVLQQLVSPYGKTDTASVLHEAMGYIRFLHDQVKVLSMPYLIRSPPSSSSSLNPSHSENGGQCAKGKDSTDGLRSRGLCLVPVECILDLAECNAAGFWAPTTCTN